MLHLTWAQLQLRRFLGPLSVQSERHLACCRRCQAQDSALRSRFRMPVLRSRRGGFCRPDDFALLLSLGDMSASSPAAPVGKGLPTWVRRLLPCMGIRAAGIVAMQQAVARIEAGKRRLGLATPHSRGALEARLTPDQTVLVRYRSPMTLFERSPAWERRVEIAVGPLRLQIHGVRLDAGILFYVRVGSWLPESSEHTGETFVPRSGLELTMIAADTPARSATTSGRGQAIFHLMQGMFTLLLPPQTGWELRIVWYP